jgi:hypothetical protein
LITRTIVLNLSKGETNPCHSSRIELHAIGIWTKIQKNIFFFLNQKSSTQVKVHPLENRSNDETWLGLEVGLCSSDVIPSASEGSLRRLSSMIVLGIVQAKGQPSA